MDTQADRLKIERIRLGLSQESMATQGGVKRLAQVNYEKGVRKPKSSYLHGIAQAGADIDYILTGVRADPIAKALEEIEKLLEADADIEKEGLVKRLNALKPKASDMQQRRIDLLLDLIGDTAAKRRRLAAQSEVGKIFEDSRVITNNAFDALEWDASIEVRDIVFTACFHGMNSEGAIALVKMLRDLQKAAAKPVKNKKAV